MKKLIFVIFILFLAPLFVLAEDKPITNEGDVLIIPKIPQTVDDPVLFNGHVYPFWGPVCQRYTYSVIYKDKEGRAPEYVRMYFNGEWLEMAKEDPENNDYQNGVKYIYKFVPTKIGSNFYFFEASNGLGKARDSIIDSPDNGPVLFEADFLDNEIVLIEKDSGQVLWHFSTGQEWIGGLALSDDGKYLAIQSSHHIYLFDTSSSKPLWAYEFENDLVIGGDVKGGIGISTDGSKIFASISNYSFLFNKDSNEPVWQFYNPNGNAYNVAISADGNYAAAAMAGGGECETGQVQCEALDALILWSTESNEPLWVYQARGNFHDVSFSSDGSFLAAATGCPDRRAYIFSKNSNEPLVRSEMLTRDSPVHQAKISASGQLAAFGAESDDGAVFLFNKDSVNHLWKFPAPYGASVRALSITSDGNYIGAATIFGGNAYIFSQDSPEPISSWQVAGINLGALDISDDGSFIAVGGNNNKVYIFEKGLESPTGEISLEEYVGEIDISANGKYIAAGTSGSVYFFESSAVVGEESEVTCLEVVEPDPEKETSLATEDKELSILQGGVKENSWQDILKDFIYHEGKLIIIAFLVLLIATLILFFKFKKKWIWLIFGILIIILVGLSFYFIEFSGDKDNLDFSEEENFQLETDSVDNLNSKIQVNQGGVIIEEIVE